MSDQHHDNHGHDSHEPHGSLKDYSIGFLLSVILTAIPFWIVMDDVIPRPHIAGIVLLCFAAIQVVVHMVYFLHMTPKVEKGWSMLALIFTAVLVFILMAGSLWVMFHLNNNMMPHMMDPNTVLHQMP